jgi:hypothetical protein
MIFFQQCQNYNAKDGFVHLPVEHSCLTGLANTAPTSSEVFLNAYVVSNALVSPNTPYESLGVWLLDVQQERRAAELNVILLWICL